MRTIPFRRARASRRETVEREPGPRTRRRNTKTGSKVKIGATLEAGLDSTATACFERLRAWRAQHARESGLPAYVIFHDATLAAIAARAPQALQDLQGVSGIGATKLERYGQAVLDACLAASAH